MLRTPRADVYAHRPTTYESLWSGVACVQQAITDRAPVDPRESRGRLRSRGGRPRHRSTGRDSFHFQVSASGVLVDALSLRDTESTPTGMTLGSQVRDHPPGWSAGCGIPVPPCATRASPARWVCRFAASASARHEVDAVADSRAARRARPRAIPSLGPFAALPDHASVELRPFALRAVEHAAGFHRDGSRVDWRRSYMASHSTLRSTD